MKRYERLTLVSLAATAGVLLAVAVGSVPGAPARAPHQQGRLVVGVEVLHFSAAGRTLTGKGLVTATLIDYRGRRTTTRTLVALTASTGGNCRVLHLYLNELTLSLLGLHAHLDKVQLDITGNARGGVLGSLFCRLARARVASGRASAASAITAAFRRQGNVVRFTATVSPKATASAASNPTCQVLDLVVGPLNLQLLGLVVDLKRVHLTVTATRGQGALGDLFCQLADNSPSTTSTSTSPATTASTPKPTSTGTTGP